MTRAIKPAPLTSTLGNYATLRSSRRRHKVARTRIYLVITRIQMGWSPTFYANAKELLPLIILSLGYWAILRLAIVSASTQCCS